MNPNVNPNINGMLNGMVNGQDLEGEEEGQNEPIDAQNEEEGKLIFVFLEWNRDLRSISNHSTKYNFFSS